MRQGRLACLRRCLAFAALAAFFAAPAAGDGFLDHVAGPAAGAGPVPHAAPPAIDPRASGDVAFRFGARAEGHDLPLTDVHVAFDDAVTLVRVHAAVSDGPFLVASVPQGRYRVTASHAGRAQVIDLDVAPGEALRVALYW